MAAKRSERPPTLVFGSAVLAAAMAAGACADHGPPEWNAEVMLQLFVSASLVDQIGTLEIRAQQAGGAPRSLTVESPQRFFASCDSNRVRIIPATGGNVVRDAVTVTVSSSNGAFDTVQRTLARDERGLLLGPASTAIAPSDCTASYLPDGGVIDRDGGVIDRDGGVIRRGIGEPCLFDDQCVDGECVGEVRISEVEKRTMPGGYCSRDCSANRDCGEDATCQTFFDINDVSKKVAYCLLKCTEQATCREGYECTTYGLCFAKPHS